MKRSPVSWFNNIRSNKPTECLDVNFDEFTYLLETYSQESFSSKEVAPLLCTTRFSDSRRRKASATVSGIVVLDVDDGIEIESVYENIVQIGVTATMCTTASHRFNHHKFRVYVPLEEPVQYEEHRTVWAILNDILVYGEADASKIGCESMFFVPGKYPNAPSEFEYMEGDVFSGTDWIDAYACEELVSKSPHQSGRSRTSSTPKTTRRLKSSSTRYGRDPTFADLSLSRTGLITDRALDAYYYPSGCYHHARFRLMLSIAGKAKRKGIALESEHLVELFNKVDAADGGYYQAPDYQKQIRAEAQKALNEVQ